MLYTNEAIVKRKAKSKRIMNRLQLMVYIIVIPLIVYNISLILQAIISPDKTPDFLGYKTYVIVSGSMEPTYNIGDIAIVKSTDQKYDVGDTISFRQGETVVTHRITEVMENNSQVEYKTKGDNNNAEDQGVVKGSAIEGKVIGAIPFLGYAVLWLQNGIVIIVLLLFAYVYIAYTGNMKKKKTERNIKRIAYENKKRNEQNEYYLCNE